jgi:hypothetical protein
MHAVGSLTAPKPRNTGNCRLIEMMLAVAERCTHINMCHVTTLHDFFYNKKITLPNGCMKPIQDGLWTTSTCTGCTDGPNISIVSSIRRALHGTRGRVQPTSTAPHDQVWRSIRVRLSSMACRNVLWCMRKALTWPPLTSLNSEPSQYRWSSCTDARLT